MIGVSLLKNVRENYIEGLVNSGKNKDLEHFRLENENRYDD